MQHPLSSIVIVLIWLVFHKISNYLEASVDTGTVIFIS